MSVTMSLRVTRDKRQASSKPFCHNKENIDHIIEKLKPLAHNVTGGDRFLKDLKNCKDLRSQIETLYGGSTVIKQNHKNKEKQEELYFTTIVEILLSVELKSPLRSAIIRKLKEFSSDGEVTEIKIIISKGLTCKFSECSKNTSSILSVANTLCGMFDNFPLGVEGVKICQSETYNFIVSNLTFCKDTLRCSLSDVSEELCQCTHALVRAALHFSNMSTWLNQVQLHDLASELVAFSQLPLDTRHNCGMLAVTTGRYNWLQILKKHLVSEDYITSLCMYAGFILCLPMEDMGNVTVDDKTVLQLLFDTIMDNYLRHPLHPIVTLSVARTLVNLSKELLGHPQLLPPLLPRLLTYCWEHLEHTMDSVKHSATSLLNNIAKMHSQDVDVHGPMLAAVRTLPMLSRARCTALAALVGKVPISLLVPDQDISYFYQQLTQVHISSHTLNVFQELSKQHYAEVDNKEEWKNMWVKPLLRNKIDKRIPFLDQFLKRAVSVCPDIVNYVLSLPDGDANLSSRLLCLCYAKELGLLERKVDEEDKWRGLVDYELLRTAVTHEDVEARLSCLSLIVKSPKTTAVFTSKELELIMDYVKHYLNMENSALRQQNSVLLLQFVNRFNESWQVLERTYPSPASELQSYRNCKLWLEQCCLENLFPGATFIRKVTVLQLLTTLGVSQVEPSTTATLLACLADTYEEVKDSAMTVLLSTPGLLNEFDVPETAVMVIEKALESAGGVRPPECMSGAYLLATLCQTPLSPRTLSEISNKYGCSSRLPHKSKIEYKSVYLCLLIVTQELSQQLVVAKVSVLKAAQSAPMYGLLYTINLLLSYVKLRECSSKHWRRLIKNLIDLSFECSQAVASVVNNDSPEGHLPMDFDFDPGQILGSDEEEEEREEEEGMKGVTSQMVLLCSWRTVKEASLLLGFLTKEAKIALSSKDDGQLDCEDIVRIGDHLTTLLAETKHRGAFEQAYIGFYQLVSRLWRLPSGPLKALPEKWLKDTMEDIGSENLCATRRGAGIPFMIQALVSTQLEVKGLTSVEPWFTRLLDIAASPAVSGDAHTHSFNILRALFRSTILSEAVGLFMERAIMATITAFGAASWMERNSATLLLSALMIRVFGVPRSKSQDDLGWKNKMTGRIFFQRYPNLFGFFQEELRKASESSEGNSHPTLYPVLLILGRLYPSSLEGTESNMQLTQFIPYIQMCAGSNIYKTRMLAASASVALLSGTHLDSLINKVTEEKITRNLRHGLILQVDQYIKKSEPKVDKQIIKNNANIWTQKLLQLTINTNLSTIELESLFRLLISFCEKYFDIVDATLWEALIMQSRNVLKVTLDNDKIANCLLRPIVFEFLLRLSVLRGGKDLSPLCCEMLVDKMSEVRNTGLDFINCLIYDDDECSQMFCGLFKNLTTSARDELKSEILAESVVPVFVKMVLSMFFMERNERFHSEDKVKVLMVLQKWKEAFIKMLEHSYVHPELNQVFFIIDLCNNPHEQVAVCGIQCLSRFMDLKQGTEWTEEELTAVCEVLTDLNTDTPDSFSTLVHEFTVKHFETLQLSKNPTNRLRVYKLYIELMEGSRLQSAVDRVCQSEGESEVTSVLLTALTLGHFKPSTTEATGMTVDDVKKQNAMTNVVSSYINSIPAPRQTDQPLELTKSNDISQHIKDTKLILQTPSGMKEITITDETPFSMTLRDILKMNNIKIKDVMSTEPIKIKSQSKESQEGGLKTAETVGATIPNGTGRIPKEEGRVFIKEELSGICEEYMMSKVCGERLRQLPKEVMERSLRPESREWLFEVTGLSGGTLSEIIGLAKQESSNFVDNCPWQFLLPGYQIMKLNSLKIKNVL